MWDICKSSKSKMSIYHITRYVIYFQFYAFKFKLEEGPIIVEAEVKNINVKFMST